MGKRWTRESSGRLHLMLKGKKAKVPVVGGKHGTINLDLETSLLAEGYACSCMESHVRRDVRYCALGMLTDAVESVDGILGTDGVPVA